MKTYCLWDLRQRYTQLNLEVLVIRRGAELEASILFICSSCKNMIFWMAPPQGGVRLDLAWVEDKL